ncbi:MAG: hypothetical protein ACO1TE_03685 [Prosthecobacter sp.]
MARNPKPGFKLGQAIAATLASPEKRGFWLAAHSLAGMLGPGFDRSQIVAAVRENLPRYLVLDDARIKSGQAHKLIHVAAHVLCYHGTEADVARIASFAFEVARFIPPWRQRSRASSATATMC